MRPLRRGFVVMGVVAATWASAQQAPTASSTVAPGLRAEVIHWWTSGGESAAAKAMADAYKAQGGVWVDMAVALGEQARAIAINRIVGGNPPTAAQFNTSKQFLDMVDQGMLNPMDDVARKEGWDKFLPDTVLQAVRVKGHYYAAPINIHMPTWIWYSKAAFKKAGIANEPRNMDELFEALDKLKAGLRKTGSNIASVFTGTRIDDALYEELEAALLMSDAGVKAILVNIFGGITRGDEVARGLIEARAQQERTVPMVVRIVGTNAREAAELLAAGGFATASSLDEAAETAVALAKGSAA